MRLMTSSMAAVLTAVSLSACVSYPSYPTYYTPPPNQANDSSVGVPVSSTQPTYPGQQTVQPGGTYGTLPAGTTKAVLACPGVYSGQWTNPDSGGPWSAVFRFNQCNRQQVSGVISTVREPSRQERPFTGTLNGDNTVTLDIGYPNNNGAGPYPCYGVKARLTIGPNSLVGPWTSTNCQLGGVYSVWC